MGLVPRTACGGLGIRIAPKPVLAAIDQTSVNLKAKITMSADICQFLGPMKKSLSPHVDVMQGLDDRPGFLIRRAHQISQSIFIEECSGLDITSTQFGVLSVLARAGELDQISVARLLGFDRSTTGLVVKLLERRALIVRTPSATDRRKHVLRLTAAGENLRRRAEPLVDRVRARLEGAFTPKQAVVFFKLLDQFTRSFDDTARVPLRRPSRT